MFSLQVFFLNYWRTTCFLRKKVANWHVHWTNIYFHRRVMYRGILQSIGIIALAHYHDYHRQLGEGFENYLTSICQTDELMDFALSRVLKIIPTLVFVHQKFKDESGEIVRELLRSNWPSYLLFLVTSSLRETWGKIGSPQTADGCNLLMKTVNRNRCWNM